MKFAQPGLGLQYALAATLAVQAMPLQADVKDGVDAWSRGDYSAAVAEWQGPAAAGDPDAQFNMAQAYRLGRGVEADNAKAQAYYEQAAANGHLKAADNYGLMLFQQGQKERAMPFIRSAAERGDPRAQYVLGLAYFNGDMTEQDWVRAYALVSLAQAASLPQAAAALQQMDGYVPLEDRQRAQLLAADLRREADARRSAQLASVDLASGQAMSVETADRILRQVQPQPLPPSSAAGLARSTGPASAGADYARPKEPVLVAGIIEPNAAPPQQPMSALPQVSAPTPPAHKPSARPAAANSDGKWRVQLGAFGVAGNAQKLWGKLSGSTALRGKQPFYVSTGKLTRLLAGGFATRAEAQAACKALSASGQGCIVVGG